MKIKLYIDIDGVLLSVKQTKIALDAILFIEYATTNFDCYWLTTHCKGNSQTAINYLAKYFDEKTIKHLLKIKPTNWTTLKTEAIDLCSDFIWLDDYPFEAEMKILKDNGKSDKLILVDLNRIDELKNVITYLKIAKMK